MKLPRVYPILDTAALAARGMAPDRAAAAMLEGGAGILQLRHKGHWSRSVYDDARQIAKWCAEDGALLVINDRADVALLLEAGLHVGQDDLPPRDARNLLGRDAILGYSTHHPRQVSAAGGEPVDYVALGPVFGTASKQNPDPVVGLEQLRECRALVEKPLVAIGGITRERAAAVWAAGADVVAVIADLLPEPCTARALRQRMEEWQQLAK
ncbi:MAG TPA: thiamine phosphate synthase [Bryobacteraceae bacterium]|nr:thiamine phosphate synthase [Bryobacteraceae bacterium]